MSGIMEVFLEFGVWDNGGVLGIWCLGIMEVFLEFGVWG